MKRGSRPAAIAALAVLAAALIGLAAPGPALVPGAGEDAPGWVLGVFGDGLGLEGAGYLALLYAAFAAYLVVAWGAPRLGPVTVRRAVAAAVVLFALAPPLLSLDVFSYVSYGRLQVEGLNPYEAAPADLPADEAASRVQDYREAVSVYGPLFTAFSYLPALLGAPAALWAMKALAALGALALATLAARVAAARGADPLRARALVGLNPILLVHGVGGAHNDVLMALGLLAAVWLAGAGRPAWAGASLAAAAAVKAAGAIAAPFALLGAAGRGRLAAGALAAAGAVAALALVLYGTAAAEALDVLGGSQDRVSRYSVPATLSRATGADLDAVRAVLVAGFAALLVWLGWRAWRGMDWPRAAGWALLGLLLATAYLTPWYALWALPLAAVSRDRAQLALLLALCAFQLVNSIPL